MGVVGLLAQSDGAWHKENSITRLALSLRKALTCRAFSTSCFKEVGIGTSLRQNTELDESFFFFLSRISTPLLLLAMERVPHSLLMQ